METFKHTKCDFTWMKTQYVRISANGKLESMTHVMPHCICHNELEYAVCKMHRFRFFTSESNGQWFLVSNRISSLTTLGPETDGRPFVCGGFPLVAKIWHTICLVNSRRDVSGFAQFWNIRQALTFTALSVQEKRATTTFLILFVSCSRQPFGRRGPPLQCFYCTEQVVEEF